MTFSPFDRRLLEEGLAYFARPRLAGLLETLGRTASERAETLTTMLRDSPAEEFDEAVALFERAARRAGRARGTDARWDGRGREETRRRRPSAAAERRAERRRRT